MLCILISKFMVKDLIYIIKKENISKDFLTNLLNTHSEIKFVSLIGIDINGNDTDEKIPSKVFINDIDLFFNGCAVQTDGSSVVLTGIATLNDAKVDMVIDKNCNWFIDYNFDNIDEVSGKPIGTLKIPSFLIHNEKYIDSRSVLNRSLSFLKKNLLSLLKSNPNILRTINPEDIEDIIINTATELEFWVKTPEELINIEDLTTSQDLHEQYWNITKGIVRTALEKTLSIMENYDLYPEMGHKEVGGVKSKIDSNGKYHILEQLEIDWKYSTALQSCDNILIVKSIIKETFKRHGLDVTFCAKPIEKVAGNGAHLHFSIFLKLKNGQKINLFHDENNEFMSSIAYGSLMGILKHHNIISPFVSNTIDSLKRLKPGFEAPVCTVASLGISKNIPSRNRSILIALIRDSKNPNATRFELRSPNPKTNIYLTLAAINMCVVDGIKYSINKNELSLLNELSKNYGDDSTYLEKNKLYRSEDNIFEKYSEDDRDKYFGKSPKTVYENMLHLCEENNYSILLKDDVFTLDIINSFKLSSLDRYIMEIEHRIFPEYKKDIELLMNNFKFNTKSSSLINLLLNELKFKLFSDTFDYLSLHSKMKDYIKDRDFKNISNLNIEIEKILDIFKTIHSL